MTYVSLKTAAEDKEFSAVAKSLPTFMVAPGVIEIEPGFNGRPIDRAHVDSMKQAWRAGKERAHNPLPELTLRVRAGRFTLVDGEHRLTAYRELIAEGEPIERVPCKEFKGDDKQAILFMLGANSGMGWQMPQLGMKYAELVNMYGMSYSEVAAARGMSVQHVKDCIRLIEQPEEIKQAVGNGEISPSLAMKLVKKEGAEKAAETIKEARNTAKTKGAKAGKITQKAIDKASKGAADYRKQCKEHLATMLDLPSFTREQKDAVRTVMRALGGSLPDAVVDVKPIDYVDEYLQQMSLNPNDMVKDSAKLLQKQRANQFIPPNISESAKYYGHMVWLQDMAANRQHRERAAAAHWFMAVLDFERNGRVDEVAPPPSVLSLERAIQMEMESGGQVNAESMCPEHAGLVAYLRGQQR